MLKNKLGIENPAGLAQKEINKLKGKYNMNLQEYNFCFQISGNFTTSIQAASLEKAKAKAIEKCSEADFGLLENIDYNIASIVDEQDNEIQE